jgi:DNA modification methylase
MMTTRTTRSSGRRRRAPSAAAARTAGLQVTEVPIDELRPWPGNPRKMPAEEMRKLRRSLEQFGMVQPLVVRGAGGIVVGGHQRLEAAKALGLTRVPVVYVELSEPEAKALNLALNRISGEWDLPKLGQLLEELQASPDVDELLSGFGANEIDKLLAELERQQAPSPREDSFAQASCSIQEWLQQAPTRAHAGELWTLGRHRLLCGDSLAEGALAYLCEEEPVDLVLTDPPYGISFQSSVPGAGRRKPKIANDEVAEFEALLGRALPAVKATMKRGAVMYWFAGGGGGEPVLGTALLAIASSFTLLNTLVWDKMDPGLGWRWRRSWEAIIEASVGRPRLWYGGKTLRNVLRFPRAVPQADDHPTPKPVPLLEEILRAAAPAKARVLDPFAGSGATLIAAERTGRTALAAELEPRYCDLVLARWEALTGETACREEAARFGASHPRRQRSRSRRRGTHHEKEE